MRRFLLVLVLFLLAPGVSAFVLYNSTTSTAATNFGYDQVHAFNINYSSSFYIDRVAIAITGKAGTSEKAHMEIYTDNGGEPGSIVNQNYNSTILHSQLNTSGYTIFTYSNPTLLSAGTYWVVMTSDWTPTGTVNYNRDSGNPVAGSGAQYTTVVPYSWTVWGGGANDPKGYVIGIGGPTYSLPDNVSESDWIYPATDPDTDNQASVWLNWSNSTSSIGATLNYTLYVNGSKEWSGLNVSQYQWSLPAEGHYLLRVDVQDNGSWVTGDDRVFKYDATSPAIVWGGDLASDNSTVTNAAAIWVNDTLTDDNAVWGYNVSLSYKANGSVLSYFNLSGISQAATSFNRSFSLSGLPSADYLVTTLVTDSHTKRLIKDFKPKQKGLSLEYEAYGGLVTVELEDVRSWDYRQGYATRRSDKQSIRSFTTWKEGDRYVFSVDTALARNPYRTYEYMFLVSAEEKISVVEGSVYFAHLVIGDNWVDFEHSGAGSFWVERIDAFTVRVWVYSRNERAAFRSIGGLNSLTESLEFEIDVTDPVVGAVFSTPSVRNYSYSQVWTFSVEVTDSGSLIDDVFIEFDAVNYSMSFVAGNTYGGTISGSWPVGSVPFVFFANDSVGNWGRSASHTFNVSKGLPAVNLSINGSGLWLVNNGTSVSVTAGAAAGVGILLSRNGSMVSNPDDFDNPGVGLYNYTTYPSNTVNWSNTSVSQVLNVTASAIVQVAPVVSSVRLYSLTNTSLDVLQGFATIGDVNDDNMSVSYKWYRDGVYYKGGLVTDVNPLYSGSLDNFSSAGVVSPELLVDGSSASARFPVGGGNVTLRFKDQFVQNATLVTTYNVSVGEVNISYFDYGLADWVLADTLESAAGVGSDFSVVFIPSSAVYNYSFLVRLSGYSKYVIESEPSVYLASSFEAGEVAVNNVSAASLSLGDAWILSVRAFDGLNYSLWINSSALTVGLPSLNNCSSGSVVAVLNYFDEDHPSSPLNNSAEVEGLVWADNRSEYANFSFSLASNATHPICISLANGTFYADAYVKYDSAFTHRFYWVNESLVSGSAEDFYLYNFPSVGNQSTLEVTARYESSYEYYPGVYGRLQRSYVGEGLWRTVQMAKSGAFGTMTFNIYEKDKDYRLIFLDSASNVLDTSDTITLICSSAACALTYLLTPYSASGASASLGYSWSYDNMTGNITVVFSDPEGLTSSVRVLVSQEKGDRSVLICNETVTGSAGTIACDVSSYDGQVLLTVYSSASPESSKSSVWFNLADQALGLLVGKLVGNYEAALWTFGILLVVVGASVASPILGIIGMILGLIGILYLGLFSALSLTFVLIAMVMGIAIGLKVKD